MVKNAVIIGCSCMILFVSQTLHGSVHDKKIADLYYCIPAGFTLLQDTGYQGLHTRRGGALLYAGSNSLSCVELTRI
ncbi:MAG: hypothetical protein LBJ39_01970 [Tannerellaceae bacterium]|nr:hypothetical protein [Tannerellaceae bacterium]